MLAIFLQTLTITAPVFAMLFLGVVLKRVYIEGSEVKQGDVLFRIDPAPFKAEVDSAAAALQRAEAVLARARVRPPIPPPSGTPRRTGPGCRAGSRPTAGRVGRDPDSVGQACRAPWTSSALLTQSL